MLPSLRAMRRRALPLQVCRGGGGEGEGGGQAKRVGDGSGGKAGEVLGQRSGLQAAKSDPRPPLDVVAGDGSAERASPGTGGRWERPRDSVQVNQWPAALARSDTSKESFWIHPSAISGDQTGS